MEKEKEYIRIIISKYLSNEATQEEIDRLIAWIDDNNEHLEEFKRLKNIWEIANPAFDPNTIDVQQAYENINLIINPSPNKRSSLTYYWQKVAAVIIIPLMIISGYLYYKQLDEEESIIYQEVYSAYGSRSLIYLPDSSKVWLNAGSTIKFPTIFKGNERNVYLEGEAYFEVKSDKNNPFVVHTNKMVVKATGTEFNVEAYVDSKSTTVTLVHGKVNLLFNNVDKALKPGQKIDYNHTNSTYEINDTDTDKWCSWKDGVYAFRDDSLDYVLKRLGQIYNVTFIIKDKEISKYIYRATFQNESLDQILNLLQSSAPIHFVKKENKVSDNNYQNKQVIEVYNYKYSSSK